MLVTIHANHDYQVDLSKPLDLSIPLSNSDHNPIAWYIEKPVIEPVQFGEWIGKVSKGASTNFNKITFNPHGHGTHTECVGHITREFYSINKALTQFFFTAEVVSVVPQVVGEDHIITSDQIRAAITGKDSEALVIRTLPNSMQKRSMQYSNTNPPYLEAEAAQYIRDSGIKHLLIDLPSVDREHDEGKLAAHKAFWNVTTVDQLNPSAATDATITELIFVPDSVPDGRYLLNLQIGSFENDASPSKPILYAIL